MKCRMFRMILLLLYLGASISVFNSFAFSEVNRFCNRTFSVEFDTECMSCVDALDAECPDGAQKITTGNGTYGCSYSQLFVYVVIYLKGCYHSCQRSETEPECCPGYWGQDCIECPGGADNPCFGNGVCSDRRNNTGECTCQDGYKGFACELCANDTTFGQNCSEACLCVHGQCYSRTDGDGTCVGCDSGWQGLLCDKEIVGCSNLTCQNNSHCKDVSGVATCVCDRGFQDVNGSCEGERVCETLTPCDGNATCKSDHPGRYTCSCNTGYRGDGYVCLPVDPCQIDNGDCPGNTTVCVYTGPGQSRCDCRLGYIEYVEKVGCSMQDMCKPDSCQPYADCSTIKPLQFKCTCKVGYKEIGQHCYTNIVKTLEDLNQDDIALRGQLQLAIQAVNQFYFTELSQHGPFTMFVSVDSGFRGIGHSNFDEWLQNEQRVRQVLRQHMIVGELTVDHLTNTSVFYTLQGAGAELQVKNRGDTLKFRILGAGNKARILRKDVKALNGVIHVITTLMTNIPPVQSYSHRLALDLINGYRRYEGFSQLIVAAGEEGQELFRRENVTILVPNNFAVDKLPTGSKEYLSSPEGRAKLIPILQHHVINTTIEVASLINMDRVVSLANTAVGVAVTKWGQLQFDGKINVTQSDILSSNGLMYEVDGFMIPDSVGSTLPSRCNKETYKAVKGPCGDCREEARCHRKEDQELTEVVDCVYWAQTDGQYKRYAGCARLCNRTYTEQACCPGFYGKDCIPCPGGYKNPCNSNGQCQDGLYGDGTCQCDENFDGEACTHCYKHDYFGANCSQACTCLQGVCYGGPSGSGLCYSGSCKRGYTGLNCDRHYTLCGPAADVGRCHAYAMCVLLGTENTGYVYKCVCLPGYRGTGTECEEIDPCLENRGGCHIQATCTKTQPGKNTCTCNDGWTGDGTYCYPASSCTLHADCHEQATCIETRPWEHICRCNDGYHGNGTYCVLTDKCQQDHGGCDPLAICVPTGPGNVNCTCRSGYGGDGYTCYGDLVTEILRHPNLTQMASLVKRVPDMDNFLLYGNYTIFAVHDNAVNLFLSKSDSAYWQSFDNIMTLASYHTIPDIFSTEALLRWKLGGYSSFETMADGFSLHVFSEGQVVSVAPRLSAAKRAKIIQGDIVALNGYIHIIDMVLEPFQPPTEKPTLKEFFDSHPEYSIFGQWLQTTGVWELMEDLNEYTLFIPDNTAANSTNRTITADYLKYYIIPYPRLLITIDDGNTMDSWLGQDHQLLFNVRNGFQVFINSVQIVLPDVFTDGGMVNGINGLLHPVLKHCDEVTTEVENGPCLPCGIEQYHCPSGSSPLGNESIMKNCMYKYQEPRRGVTATSQLGCHGLCVRKKTIVGCCSGYYGKNCDECPGGPEFPCSGHGTCSDGINGTGVCQCEQPFVGAACDQCTQGWAGSNCDIDIYSCAYKNGGCSVNAECHGTPKNISCKCFPGYTGDGVNCTGPCDFNNGGCHENAECKVYGEKKCICKSGYIGDGTKMCNGNVLDTMQHLDSADQFLKVLNSSNSTVLQGLLSNFLNSSQQFTVFVPAKCDRLHDNMLADKDILSQVVAGQTIKLVGNMAEQTYTTQSKLKLLVKYRNKQYYVNGSRVLQANILCVNGIIHVVDHMFTMHVQEKPTQASSSPVPVGLVVGPVVGVILVAIVIIVVVIVYKKYKSGGWDYWSRLPLRKDSSDSVSHAQLHMKDSDDSTMATPGNINFGNPLYNVKDDL